MEPQDESLRHEDAGSADSGRSRRGALRTAVTWALGLGTAALGATLAMWTAAVGRFAVPNATSRSRRLVPVGAPAAFPRGHVETRFAQSHGLWLVHGEFRGRWQLFALSTACTHLGCITRWRDDLRRFQCPCHGSAFSADGINREGPAPRPLVRYAIALGEDGQLQVDRDRVFCCERGEWEDPACYVCIEG